MSATATAATAISSTSLGGGGMAGDGEEYMMASEEFEMPTSIVRLCLAIFGVVANTITAVVLTNKKLWSPTSLLLLTLVVYDALFLLAYMPFCAVDVMSTSTTFTIVMGVFYPLKYMAQTGSIYTTVMLTIERFLIVLRPLRARVFCTFGKIRRLTLIIFLFSVFYNIPRCFFFILTSMAMFRVNNSNMTVNFTSQFLQVTPSPDDGLQMDMTLDAGSADYNVSMSEVMEAYARREYYMWLYLRVYELYLSGVFFYLLPYVLIPILNVQLLMAIKRRRDETRRISAKNRHQMANVKPTDKEDGLTMIVLGITVCFCICCLIPAIYITTQIAGVDETPSAGQTFLLIASDTMLCINASTDFFFYCLLGRKFRKTFLVIFCPRACVDKARSTNGTTRYTDTYYHSV